MDMNAENLVGLVTRLSKIREEHGEEAWREAMKQFAFDALKSGGQYERFAKVTFEKLNDPQLNWEAIEAEYRQTKTEKDPHEAVFMRALQQQLPALKSQAQFTAFQTCFEAFRMSVNGILVQNPEMEAKGKEALTKSFDALRQATGITIKLEDVPEAVTSAAGDIFKRPPAEFKEYDIQRALLTDLEEITTLGQLNEWWAENREKIDQVKSPQLRNPLIDLVRKMKAEFAEGAHP